ncbi:MAG: glycosyltransferase family 2 protein [Flavobacteriales bacterium]|nr:glycosyltransferase family 2 protein [Flavobacteriales bacterium]
MSTQKLSILVPAYNEERTIVAVLNELVDLELPSGIGKEVVVVDDRSTDRTAEVVEQFIAEHGQGLVYLVRQEVNRGKGAAIHQGLNTATGTWVVMQDADLELDARDIVPMLGLVLGGKADVVYGNRFHKGLPYSGFPFGSYMANIFLTWLSNRFTGLSLGDMEVCYKLMSLEVARSLALYEQRFGFEPEVTAALARRKELRWSQVPVSYRARSAAEGKKIGWKDGVHAIWCILKYR